MDGVMVRPRWSHCSSRKAASGSKGGLEGRRRVEERCVGDEGTGARESVSGGVDEAEEGGEGAKVMTMASMRDRVGDGERK